MQATSVSDPKNQAPSNEMVERVARAICREDASVVPSLGDMHLHVNNCWRYFVRQARAAIEAMREPTEALQAAGAHRRENRKPVADIWRAMIDEALR